MWCIVYKCGECRDIQKSFLQIRVLFLEVQYDILLIIMSHFSTLHITYQNYNTYLNKTLHYIAAPHYTAKHLIYFYQ